jgi:putative component of toxin-antitoxin plasmid stabilization module
MIDSIINLKMSNGINVRIDKGDIKVSQYYIQDYIEDLLELRIECEEGSRINLSNICDCVFDLIFCGSNKNTKEMSFRIC